MLFYNKHFYNVLRTIQVNSNLKVPFQEYFLDSMNENYMDDMVDMEGYFLWLEAESKYYGKYLKKHPGTTFEQYQEIIKKARKKIK